MSKEFFNKYINKDIVSVEGDCDEYEDELYLEGEEIKLVFPAHTVRIWVSEWGGIEIKPTETNEQERSER